ncbi:hemoglobin/transferrin/lactoferrin receptor protein [Acinetobacter calcoaceticus]|uniref:Hemoglobin/transferrin/lactoferrin receptor protein n=1 Tax=Acinetobacter calcoaceticus TaxID=471 RepID=A0A4R1YA73_ACICA|nr:hemoglobin/transferrin/lactoferrin receptor protein [Acinetobacter calcoaceticus]
MNPDLKANCAFAYNRGYRLFLLCLISSGYSGVVLAKHQQTTPAVSFASSASTSSTASTAHSTFLTSTASTMPVTTAQQSDAHDPNQPVRLSTIVVQATQNTDLNHLNEEQLQRFAPMSAGDLLQGQAGVHLGDSRNGGAVDVNVRGMQGQSRVAVTVDGAQQSLDVYRGYAGMQNRSYIDPLLISSVDIHKGPSTKAGGAIGGTVAMQSLGAEDILIEGKTAGLRLTGNFADNGRKAVKQDRQRDDAISLAVKPSMSQGDIASSQSRSGSIAAAWHSDQADFVAAYAQRLQGNYFAGKRGREGYRSFNAAGDELDSVAKVYAAGEEVLNSSAATQSLLLKSILRPWQDHQLSVSYLHTQSEYGDVMPSDIIRTGQANLNQYPLGHNRINTLSSKYEYRPAQNDLIHFEGLLWSTQAKTNQLSASFLSPQSQMFRSDRAWSPLENNRIGLELSNQSKFNTAWGDWVLNIGGAAKHERLKPQAGTEITQADQHNNKLLRDAERQEYSLALSLEYLPVDALRIWAGINWSENKSRDHNKRFSPIMQERQVRQISVTDQQSGYSGTMYWFPDQHGQYTAATDPRLNNAVVFQDSNNPFDGKRYNQLSQNLEISESDEETLELVTGFNATSRPDQKYSGFAPNFGVEYQFSPMLQSYLSYSAQTRLPSLLETSMGTHQVTPGVDLKPELAKNWEAGLKLNNQQGLTAKLNYFNNTVDDFITRYYSPGSFGAMSFSNMDAFKSSGIEFELKYEAGAIFTDFSASHYLKVQSCDVKFAQKLRSLASSANKTANTPDCTDGGFMGSYLNTQNPPQWSAHLTLGTRWLDDRLSIGTRYRYSSKPMSTLDKPWQTSATTVQMKQQAVQLIDLFADYKISQHAMLNLSVQNLSNRYYLDPLATSYMPAPGRTLNFGMKFFH